MEDDDFESSAILPKRVNEPPPVFSGCTFIETLWIIGGSFVFWMVIGVPLGVVVGMGMVMLGASLVLTLISTYVLAFSLRAIKAGKPVGYFGQKYRMFLEDVGLGVSHLYRVNGRLETGRSHQYISVRRIERDPDPELLMEGSHESI